MESQATPTTCRGVSFDALRQELEWLKSEIIKANEQAERCRLVLIKEMQVLQQHHDKLSSLFESTKNARETSHNDFKQMQTDYEQRLLAVTRQKRQLEVSEATLNSELEETEVQNSTLKEESQQLKRNLKQALSDLEQFNAFLRGETDRHRRELDPLKEENTRLRQEQCRTEKENLELHKEIEQHTQQIECHEKQTERHKKQIEELFKFKEEYESLVEENRTLKQEVVDMHQHYKSILTENQDLERQIRETTDALNEERRAKDMLEIQLREESLGHIDEGMTPFSGNKAPSLLSELQTYFMANGDLSELEALQQRCKESEDSITALRREKIMLEEKAAEGISRTDEMKENHTRYAITFTLASYGTLLLFLGVAVPLGFALQNINGPHYAWCCLWYDTRLVWAFITPLIILILANTGFFIMANTIMYRHQKRESKTKPATVKHRLKAFTSLVIVMGIMWIIGILVLNRGLLFVTYVYTMFIGLQGLIIFIFFMVQSNRVREVHTKWWKEKVASSNFFSRLNQMLLQAMAVFCHSVGVR